MFWKLQEDVLDSSDLELLVRFIRSGNLLLQPFLKTYYDPGNFKNADFIHSNSFYIGNNQFVNGEKLKALKNIMEQFFKKEAIPSLCLSLQTDRCCGVEAF